MTLQEMIEQGRNITDNNDKFYYWVDTVEKYLEALPNKSYISKAEKQISNCRELGHNTIRRKESINQIIAILIRIYDNEQEKFLQENVNDPLLSIFEDDRMCYVKQEFEDAVKHLNEGRYKQSVIFACKSVESIMKAICDFVGIEYDENKDTFDKLSSHLKECGVLPLDGMIAGHQVMRNKVSHGTNPNTYDPSKEDAILEVNRNAALLIYLYDKSGMRDNG